MREIVKAEFVTSNTKVERCPEGNLPEYAFIGRSNVGKSSLINMLTKRKNLAKTAAKPGKTQLINHFLINDEWFLVDLPGYGYASTSKSKREEFGKMITDYVTKRENLVCLFVLIDSRLKPQAIDLSFMRMLGESGIPFAMVFTKFDKLNKSERGSCVAEYSREMLKEWESMPKIFTTSATDGTGREELLKYIDCLNSGKFE